MLLTSEFYMNIFTIGSRSASGWFADGPLADGSVNICLNSWAEDTMTTHIDGTIRHIVIQDPKVNQSDWILGCQNDIFNIKRFNEVVYHRN